MDSNLTVSACILVRDGCGMTYSVDADGNIEFSLGSARDPVEVVFDTPAMRHFLELGGNALTQVAVSIVHRESGDTDQGETLENPMNDDLADWAEDKVLIAELSRLNSDIARYVMRYLDIDAGRAEPISTHDEKTFGQQLIDLGERVQSRAIRRAVHGPLTEHNAQPRTLESGQPDTDDTP